MPVSQAESTTSLVPYRSRPVASSAVRMPSSFPGAGWLARASATPARSSGFSRVSAARQVGEGAALQQVAPVLVDERAERDQVEGAVRAHEEEPCPPEERAHRLHHLLIERPGEGLWIARRIGERLAQLPREPVDL